MQAIERAASGERVPEFRRQIHFVRNDADLGRIAAEAFVGVLEDAVAARGVATVALSGGATPRALYERLTEGPLAVRMAPLWPKVHIFWTGERHVRPDHPESCYRMAHWSLLSRIAIPSINVHRIRAEMSEARDAAVAYHERLRTFFTIHEQIEGGLPRFDLVVLGLEDRDETSALENRATDPGRWVVTRWCEQRGRHEIGLSLPVLNNARRALVLLPDGDAGAAGRAAHLLRFVA